MRCRDRGARLRLAATLPGQARLGGPEPSARARSARRAAGRAGRQARGSHRAGADVSCRKRRPDAAGRAGGAERTGRRNREGASPAARTAASAAGRLAVGTAHDLGPQADSRRRTTPRVLGEIPDAEVRLARAASACEPTSTATAATSCRSARAGTLDADPSTRFLARAVGDGEATAGICRAQHRRAAAGRGRRRRRSPGRPAAAGAARPRAPPGPRPGRRRSSRRGERVELLGEEPRRHRGRQHAVFAHVGDRVVG